jgi:arylsulfatase A-like enzyme
MTPETTRFTQAFSAAQWTIPSHSSMFTGLYPSQHTTFQSFSRLPASIPTLAERLRDGGYYTAAFCNNPLVGVVDNGLRRGFLSFLNYSGLMTSHPNQAGTRPRPSLLDRYRQLFKRVLMALFGRIQDSFARSEMMLALSFSPVMVPLWQTALSFKGNTARSLKHAARLLTERRGLEHDQPVFSFINLMGTHLPYHPSRQAMERFAPHVLRDKAAQRYLRRFNSDIYGWLAPLAVAIDDERKATLDSMYNAEVYEQDLHVGQFLQQLRSSGALDNTLLIVCADHGDHLGEKQLVGHIFSVYNELVRVPLLIRDPAGDLPRGATVDQAVSTRRLFQTMLTSAGLATPEEERYTLAQSPAADPDNGVVFSEGVPPQNVVNLLQRRHPQLIRARHCDLPRRAVLNGEHKLIKSGDQHAELYNLRDDPTEQHNLLHTSPEQVHLLDRHLQAFLAQATDDAPLAEQIPAESDPAITRRLRDLGYLDE